MKRSWLIGGSIVFVGIIIMLASAILYVDWLGTKSGPHSSDTLVYIEPGSSLSRVAANLHYNGVIEHPWHFGVTARVNRKEKKVYAGEYLIPAGASVAAILDQIAQQKRYQRKLVLPEGFSVLQLERLLKGAEGLDMTGYSRPEEGSVLPETYFYERGDTAKALVERMQGNMYASLMDAWDKGYETAPVSTPEEAIILASIIEKETALAEERGLVAAVFANRLKQGMRLQSDPTVIYGITKGLPLGRPISRTDLRNDTPFNTYRIKALPASPIANPGIESIKAAINPADAPYLYFVADGTGGHAFAETLEEHNKNVANWRRIEKKRRAAKKAGE